MAVNLTGKVAIVTGAARGIGAACSARLAGQGAAVVCVDVLADQLDEKVEATSAAGSQAIAVTADVATAEGNELAVEAAIESYGGLDIFHANAACRTSDASTQHPSTHGTRCSRSTSAVPTWEPAPRFRVSETAAAAA
ncbi:MAG: hypothetical protein QOK36_3875 [Gaiellales bacterium]|nr:hypothetical protein [Gaiellales bacterium]